MTIPALERASLIGRDAELDAVARWLDLLADGPAALVIGGEAGIGKSTVWEVATAEAAARGALVLVSRPVEAELRLGYAALGDLLGKAAEPVLETLTGPLRQALSAALSLGTEPESGEPLLVGRATLAVLVELAAAGPLVLAIDDAQWLDAASARALGYAARRLAGHRVAFALSVREGHAELLGLEGALGDRAVVLHLVGVSVEALGAILHSRVQPELPRYLLRRIHARSAGNPFFAEQLAGAPEDRLPTSLDDLVRQRLEAVDRHAGAAIDRVAVLGPSPLSAFEDVTALDLAVGAGILIEQEQVVRFAHPLLATGAYARIPPGRRRALHRQAAGENGNVESRAMHLALAASGPDNGAAQVLEDAGRVARQRGAPEAAVELADHARRLTPLEDGEALARRTMDQADYLFLAADERGAVALVDELLAGAIRGPVRVRALVQKALTATDPARAVALLEEASAEPNVDRTLRTRTLAQLAWQRGAWLGDLDPAIDEALDAVEMAEGLRDDSVLVTALTTAGLVMSVAGRVGAADHFRRALAILERTPTAAGDHTPGLAFAHERWWRGDFTTAVDLMADERRLAEALGDEGLLMRLNIYGSDLATRRGRWDEAAALLERALADARDYWRMTALLRRSILRGRRGEPGALEDAAEMRASPISTSDPIIAAAADFATGLLTLAEGRIPEAAELMSRLPERSDRSGSRAAEFAVYIPETVAVLVAADQLDKADQLTAQLERRREQFEPWGDAAIAFCRGLLAQAAGDAQASQELLRVARRGFEEIGAPWELGLSLLAEGATLRRAGRRRDAAASLDRAVAIFAELRAEPALHRATEELRRARPRPSAGDNLTAAELRVAALVAEGRTNRQVAAELSTTVATVEAHLTRIYGKLAVRSRTQLARRLSEGPMGAER
jgi:DNA-binding CsgD family transcriptional regulator/tetratricopeptide (TPR) repeat protein